MVGLRGNAVAGLLWMLLLWSGGGGCQAQRAGGATMGCAMLCWGQSRQHVSVRMGYGVCMQVSSQLTV